MMVSPADVTRLHQLDNPDMVPLLYEIGKRAAALQVKAEHWSAPQPHKEEPAPVVLRSNGEESSPFIVAQTVEDALAAVEAGAVPVAGATASNVVAMSADPVSRIHALFEALIELPDLFRALP